MTAADEYLEEVIKDAFERELEVDENVARTLPFFAASLALAVSLCGYAATKLPALSWEPLSAFLHALLMVDALCLVPILWGMFQAVRVREYRIPPKETDQIRWAEELKAHYAGQGLTPKTVDSRVEGQLRSRMIMEYAESAEHNRAANLPKLRGRALGMTLLVTMLSIAFFMIGTIFISERAASAERGGKTHEPRSEGPKAKPAETATRAPAAASRTVGREVPPDSRRQHGGKVSDPTRGDQGSGKPSPPVLPLPTPKPTPVPPSHQLLRKSEGGGPVGR